jgi:hypothetical protein
MARRLAANEFEGMKALLSLAGVRVINQTTHSATNAANTAYTVTSKRTRRVIIIHLGAGNGDIRFNFGAAATATHLPVIPARYFVVDATLADTLNFWNTTGAPITVNVMEIE